MFHIIARPRILPRKFFHRVKRCLFNRKMVPCLPLWDIETRGKIPSSVFLQGRDVVRTVTIKKIVFLLVN